MDHKIHQGGGFSLKGDRGEFTATFATLGVIDHDGDVTLPGAFTPGQRVKVAAWGHNWQQPNPGVAIIDADDRRAWADGRLNLDTPEGRSLWSTLRMNGEDQQWSYGFQVLDSEPGTFQGEPVRFLKRLLVFEISPVFIGAGLGTRTDSLKRALTPERRQLLAVRADMLRREIASLEAEERKLVAQQQANRALFESCRRTLERTGWVA